MLIFLTQRPCLFSLVVLVIFFLLKLCGPFFALAGTLQIAAAERLLEEKMEALQPLLSEADQEDARADALEREIGQFYFKYSVQLGDELNLV